MVFLLRTSVLDLKWILLSELQIPDFCLQMSKNSRQPSNTVTVYAVLFSKWHVEIVWKWLHLN